MIARLGSAGALALLLSAAGCTAPRADSEIRTLVERFVASVNAADVDAFVGFFADDATAFFPSPANAMRRSGLAEIRAAVAPVFAAGKPERPLVPKDVVVTVSGDLALASFDVGSGPMHSRRTLVLRRTGQGWRIVHLHASNVRAE